MFMNIYVMPKQQGNPMHSEENLPNLLCCVLQKSQNNSFSQKWNTRALKTATEVGLQRCFFQVPAFIKHPKWELIRSPP